MRPAHDVRPYCGKLCERAGLTQEQPSFAAHLSLPDVKLWAGCGSNRACGGRLRGGGRGWLTTGRKLSLPCDDARRGTLLRLVVATSLMLGFHKRATT